MTIHCVGDITLREQQTRETDLEPGVLVAVVVAPADTISHRRLLVLLPSGDLQVTAHHLILVTSFVGDCASCCKMRRFPVFLLLREGFAVCLDFFCSLMIQAF